jgi:SH3 domain-containing protein
LAFRLCLGLAALLVPTIDCGRAVPWQSSALAGATQDAEKQAFEEAKALGTVEAWDAFLSHYPSGFHADLARAYLKKLTEDTPAPSPMPAAPSVSATDDFPVAAGSWGGVLRDGPGQNYRQIGSLQEGEPVTLMSRSDVVENGFPWFKITTQSGKTGYQWGGILCSTGAERPDIFKTCTVTPASGGGTKKPTKTGSKKNKPNKKRCPSGQYLNQNGVCQPNETGQ